MRLSRSLATVALRLALLLAVALPAVMLPAAAQSLEIQLDQYFQTVTPELYREYNLVPDSIGTLRSIIVSPEVVAEEIRLYQEAIHSGDALLPSSLVLALCHNLILHDPPTGLRFLQLLNRPTAEETVREYLPVAARAAGEAGERVALDGIAHPDPAWRAYWAAYLRDHAIYESSVPAIEARIGGEAHAKVRAMLLRALATIGSPIALPFLTDFASTATDDELQATAIRAAVEIAGAGARRMLEGLAPRGPRAADEQRAELARIGRDSLLADRYDLLRQNDLDPEQDARFTAPAVLWLRREGLLRAGALADLTSLSPARKDELLDSLVQGRGFGIWMVKRTLLGSLVARDIPRLLRMRAAAYYSPGETSGLREQTIATLVRYLRSRAGATSAATLGTSSGAPRGGHGAPEGAGRPDGSHIPIDN